MAVPIRPGKPDAAPALFRLLADSSLSRAALYTCGFPVVMLDAVASGRPVTYANAAFEAFFGYRAADAVGRPLGKLLFRADEALMQTLFAEPSSRWEMKAFDKAGGAKHVEISLSALRSAEGRTTHWVLAFSDRSDVERLRAELESTKALARTLAGSLDPGAQPARGAQQPGVEAAPADELGAQRKPVRTPHQRN